MTLDRDALIEAMAEADFMLDRPDARMPDFVRDRYIDGATAVLPVAVRAILAPLRGLHYAAYNSATRAPICPHCNGKKGVHPCGCWADDDYQPVCGVCNEGWKFARTPWPCPTVRLLDAIEADLIGDTE